MIIMNVKELSDQELESLWQLYANNIKETLTEYYKTENEELRTKAESYQDKQSVIQKEITRRH